MVRVSVHLELVVALAGDVSAVVAVDSALLVGEGVPDAQALPVAVPGSFRLVGGAPSPPGEACGGGLR